MHFTHYICVVITLINTGLYKSAISTYSFAKLFFLCFLCIYFCIYLFIYFLSVYSVLNFEVILTGGDSIYVDHFLIKCHLRSKEFLVKVIVKHFINEERCGSSKTKECKRCDHKIKWVEEIEKNIRKPNFKVLVLAL